MCACDNAFVCSRCRDTPEDPGYDSEPEDRRIEPEYWAELVPLVSR